MIKKCCWCMYVADNIHAVIRLGKTNIVFKYRVVNYRDTHIHRHSLSPAFVR